MRVLMTGDTVGGVFTYVCELSRALAARGVDVCLALTGGPLRSDQRRELRTCGASRIFADELACEWMPDPWRDVERAGAWLSGLADELEPDLVHLNDYAHGALPWSAPVLVVGHSCVLSWHAAVRGREAPPEWDTYRERVRSGLAGATLVVAPTAAMLRELHRHYGPLGPSAVIPNGRTATGLVRPKEPFALGAGRLWDEAKNLAALDRAAARLDWPVLVCGDPPAERPRHAQLLGRLAAGELAERLARATVFAAPARYEPFGLAALEAAHAGCALVLGDLPSLREVWGDAALYVDPDDDEALAAAIRVAISDPSLGAAARARAARYSPERMGARYLEAYATLVHAGAGAAA
jgi:glycosyltransferase involved in cell wall biosynthesis